MTDIPALFGPAVKPINAAVAREMLKFGGADYSLHAVGALSNAGARASLCGLEGSFFDPPEGPKFLPCVKCYPPPGSAELPRKSTHRRR